VLRRGGGLPSEPGDVVQGLQRLDGVRASWTPDADRAPLWRAWSVTVRARTPELRRQVPTRRAPRQRAQRQRVPPVREPRGAGVLPGRWLEQRPAQQRRAQQEPDGSRVRPELR
jgi:hypothetical protein